MDLSLFLPCLMLRRENLGTCKKAGSANQCIDPGSVNLELLQYIQSTPLLLDSGLYYFLNL